MGIDVVRTRDPAKRELFASREEDIIAHRISGTS